MITFIVKYLICGFNFLIFLTGTAILGTGIWLAIDKNSFVGLLTIVPQEKIEEFTRPGVLAQISYVLIAIGATMFLLSFLGYCGALRESQCMLTTYGILLIVILILEIAVCCLVVVYKTSAEEELKKAFKHSISKYYMQEEKGDAVTLAWDQLQTSLHCCGVDNYTDYQKNEKWAEGDEVVPKSCCVRSDGMELLAPVCTTSPSEANSYYLKGCFQAVNDWALSHLNLLIFIALAFGLVEILGVFFAFCLVQSINRVDMV